MQESVIVLEAGKSERSSVHPVRVPQGKTEKAWSHRSLSHLGKPLMNAKRKAQFL